MSLALHLTLRQHGHLSHLLLEKLAKILLWQEQIPKIITCISDSPSSTFVEQ